MIQKNNYNDNKNIYQFKNNIQVTIIIIKIIILYFNIKNMILEPIMIRTICNNDNYYRQLTIIMIMLITYNDNNNHLQLAIIIIIIK